ncbi:MAG: sodium:proton antiporter [Phycisphaeraceae bacterium]|nr:sodium:proton antiporter [Phycisphaeraceae bacterium]
MDYSDLAIVAAFAFLYSIIASRLGKTRFNGALVYVLAGFLFGGQALGWVDVQIGGEGLKILAELTLALVLFTDSANTNLATLRRIETVPIRLLFIGLPLTIVLGFATGWLFFDELGLFEVALLATMLAPTDAALGKAVVTNPAVPESVRESLNVESGLNDGICVPVLLFFLALAVGDTESGHAAGLMAKLTLQAIGIGVLVGGVAGLVGGRLIRHCSERGWVAGSWMQIPVIALALACFATAQWLEGSGFIACFVAGMIFGTTEKRNKGRFLDAAEGVGDSMALVTWFMFGAVAVGLTWQHLDWRVFAYALSSLTVIRILPVFIAAIGLGLRWETRLFMGWFGPRGLASIVFVVLVTDETLPGSEVLATTVTWTILLSVILHGWSANSLSRAYGARIAASGGTV